METDEVIARIRALDGEIRGLGATVPGPIAPGIMSEAVRVF